MIDKLIVSVVAGFLAIILVMQLLFFILPIFRKMEFDAVCHKYTLLMDRSGGMSSELGRLLENELQSRGFSDIRISSTSSALYGSPLHLHVEAQIPSRRINEALLSEEVMLCLAYQSSTICRVMKITGMVRPARCLLLSAAF